MLKKEIKGSLPDIIVFSLKTLVGAVGFILVGFLMLQFANHVATTQLAQTDVGNKSVQFIQTTSNERIGNYFLILFVFDLIGIIFTSFLITLSSIFFIFYIIFIAFAIVVSIFSMTFYNRISEIPILASYIASQGTINFVIQYAPIFTLIVGAISAIIIMAKAEQGGKSV